MASKADEYRTFAMMAKPVGASCNLSCEYCYYKSAATHKRMSDETLEAYVRQVIAMHGSKATVEFVWHGGEPLLAGKQFYRRAVALQRAYADGRTIVNNVQTNATLIDESWADLFAHEGFVVGVSCDGPAWAHDAFRKDGAGDGSFDRVRAGIAACARAGVRVDGLCAVHSANVGRPREVYAFLRSLFPLVQFLPVCDVDVSGGQARVSPSSVDPVAYGTFLCEVYDAWQADDPATRPLISLFEAVGRMRRGEPAGICELEPVCGHAGCVEANGDVYSCDRFVGGAHKLGNLLEEDLGTLMERNRPFGTAKLTTLAPDCLDCEFLRLCFGGCPGKRFARSASGAPINALCTSHRMLLAHM